MSTYPRSVDTFCKVTWQNTVLDCGVPMKIFSCKNESVQLGMTVERFSSAVGYLVEHCYSVSIDLVLHLAGE